MRRKPERLQPDGELRDEQRAQLDRAVHQVRQVRGGKLERVRALMQLRRGLPAGAGRRLKLQGGRPIVHAPGPHDRRGHVQMHVRRVHSQVRPVNPVAVDLVLDRDDIPVGRHGPSGLIGPLNRQLGAISRVRVDVVDVLGELVQRVSARRRPAHTKLEGRRRHGRERRVDLHPVMLRLGNAEPIHDSRRRVKGHVQRGHEDDDHDEKTFDHQRAKAC